MEMDYVGQRTTELYTRLKSERKKDNAQMGVGLVLFWPALIFLEGGDGPEAAEYAQLKGNYEALQDNAIQRKCGIYSKSPQQIMEEAHQEETREDEAGSE